MMLKASFLVALCVVAVIGVSCSSGSDAEPTATVAPAMTVEEPASPGPFGVGLRTIDMVDTSRPTAPNRDYAGSPQRDIQVDVYYPSASGSSDAGDLPLDTSGGPYPLIIAAHGYASPRDQLKGYIHHLVSHGYIVAAPGFPQTRIDAPGGPRLYATLDQPADVSFVLDQMLAVNADVASFIRGAINEEEIGMTGHSGGGLTTMITTYGPMRDERIDAAVAISPVGCLVPPDIGDGSTVPLMVVGGSVDRLVGPASIRLAYDSASAPKYFVSVIGADHVRFGNIDATDADLGDILDTLSRGDITGDAIRFAQDVGADPAACLEQGEGTDELISADRQRELLRTAALPFFDAHLKDDPAAERFLDETLPTLTGIRFESDLMETNEGEQ